MCVISGCGRAHKAHGYCRNHWEQARIATDSVYRDKMRAKWRAKARTRRQAYTRLRELGLAADS